MKFFPAIFITLLPFFFLIWFVAQLMVPVPMWDEWELPKLFETIQNGNISFNLFFAQHNEHRIFFPKIIFSILALLGQWKTETILGINLLLALASFIFIVLIQKNNSADFKQQLLPLGLTSFLIFSINQHGNWLSGFQLPWFFINFCFLLAVFVIHQSDHISVIRVLAGGLLCTITSFSSGQGLLIWGAFFPSVILLSKGKEKKIFNGCLWVGITALIAVFYFRGYQVQTGLPKLGGSLFSYMSTYFFVVLGGFFTWELSHAELIGKFGCLVFGYYILFMFWTLFRKGFTPVLQQMLPWVPLALYSLGFAVLTAKGRAGFG
ncbi:MAG TPA: hypothetical protein EYO73_08635, partial [Sulfurimonas sp.]|nr:hypothetical protein [Sulfurimonas sp.]